MEPIVSAQQPLQTTPPESFTSTPPTPPATQEKTTTSTSHIIAEIVRRRDGRRVSSRKSWLRFTLDEYCYRDLQRQLRKVSLWHYFEHELRHDYFPSAKLFVLRMPGLLHESLAYYTTKEILRQLDTIAQSESPSAEFARDIDNNASAEIDFTDNEYGSHQPDASFQHFEAQYPGVILEVSYCQKKRDLPRLADDYILGSDANIRVVIGIDIEYKVSKRASVSVWRPHLGRNNVGEIELFALQTVKDQLFRDDVVNLVPNPTAGLQLQLEDFVNEDFVATFPDLTQTIKISPQTLFAFLERSEAKARRVKQGEGLAKATKPWVRKRRRDSTLPEQLGSDREGRFVEQEQRAAKKVMRDDNSYRGSSLESEVE